MVAQDTLDVLVRVRVLAEEKMNFYDILNSSTEDVEKMLKRNNIKISKNDIISFFDSFSDKEKEELIDCHNQILIEANYQLVVIRYINEVLRIDTDKLIPEINIFDI